MELPIVGTTHVPGREQVERAWLRAMEMVGGAADGLTEGEGYQRVKLGGGGMDVVFGVQGKSADVVRGMAGDMPKRVVAGGEDGGMEGFGFQRRGMAVFVLNKVRGVETDLERYQVLSGRAVYGDVVAMDKVRGSGAAALLDEARLDMLVFREAGRPVGCVSLLTVNTMGLVIDFYGEGEVLRRAMMWHVLELCGRSQHKAVAAVLEPGHDAKVWVETGFAALEPVLVWDRKLG